LKKSTVGIFEKGDVLACWIFIGFLNNNLAVFWKFIGKFFFLKNSCYKGFIDLIVEMNGNVLIIFNYTAKSWNDFIFPHKNF